MFQLSVEDAIERVDMRSYRLLELWICAFARRRISEQFFSLQRVVFLRPLALFDSVLGHIDRRGGCSPLCEEEAENALNSSSSAWTATFVRDGLTKSSCRAVELGLADAGRSDNGSSRGVLPAVNATPRNISRISKWDEICSIFDRYTGAAAFACSGLQARASATRTPDRSGQVLVFKHQHTINILILLLTCNFFVFPNFGYCMNCLNYYYRSPS